MPQGMFGAPVGIGAAEKDVGQVLANQAAAVKMQREQQFQSLLKQSAQADLADLAGISARAGFVEQAGKLAKAHKDIQSGAETQNKVRMQRLEEAQRILGDVNDPVSWQKGNALFELITGQPSPVGHLPYHPSIVGKLNSVIMSEKDKITAGLQEARTEESRTRLPLIEAQTALAKARRIHLKKQGGSAVKEPPKGMKDQARLMVKGDYNISDVEVLDNAAYGLASHAQALMAANRNLAPQEALAQAYLIARENKDFETMGGIKIPRGVPLIGGLEFGAKTKYRGTGRTAATAMMVPQGTTTDNIDTNLVQGRYYVTKQGIARYVGKGMFESAEGNEEGEEE